MIKYEKYELGELQTNCYLVWDDKSKEAVVIDPADEGTFLIEEIQQKHLVLKAVLATHGHFDHLMGALEIKLVYNIPFCCSSEDTFLLNRQKQTASHFLRKSVLMPNFEKIDVELKESTIIKLGENFLKVLKTPGHTPGSVCFYSPDENLLFTGDTVFYQDRGDARFKYSSVDDMEKSMERIMKLSDETKILPGHGQATTIANEKLLSRMDSNHN